MMSGWMRILCVLGSAMLLFGCAPAAADGEDPLQVTFFDVGKGDCILVGKGGSFVLIDTGYAETANDVIAAMRQLGADHLDALVLTHYDRDHVGGTEAFLRAFPVSQVWLPGYTGDGKAYESTVYAVQKSGVPAEKVTEDVSFTISDVRYDLFATPLRFVPGEGGKEGNDNDVSLVAAIRYGEDSFLIAGDIEKEGIDAFLAAGRGTYDVVKMPHHGQNESNTGDFIDSVRMKIAVITDSEEEPVKKKVIKRITGAGAELYATAANGTVTVTSCGNGTYEVAAERNE